MSSGENCKPCVAKNPQFLSPEFVLIFCVSLLVFSYLSLLCQDMDWKLWAVVVGCFGVVGIFSSALVVNQSSAGVCVCLWYRSSSEFVLTLIFSHSRQKSAAFWTWRRSQNTARKWGEWLRADKWSLYRLQFASFFSGWVFKLHCADLNWHTKMEQCPDHLITGWVIRQTLLLSHSVQTNLFLFCFVFLIPVEPGSNNSRLPVGTSSNINT